ncbi:hypothetical protein MLD38_031379 [Melastoma candidum]|uniref:Uncharacterized protein n=1 Tax=Melastoma candidum TaxID=119954 RepID=A0ACB9MNW9_9MYRT|nr:hypothetical protein MLD38_031379 [Melastoma candidum]
MLCARLLSRGGASLRRTRLLPRHIGENFTSLCIWADRVKSRYLWSPSLHFINTPDHLCTYKYNRDCKDEDGEIGG